MALTGHLSDLSLSELIEFFCNQRKSGRLKVLYPQGAGYFYLQAGSVVDARIGVLHGIDAVYYALTLPNAEFEFSVDAQPGNRTINQPWTQVVLEGLRRLDENIAAGVAFPADYVPTRTAPLLLLRDRLYRPDQRRLCQVANAGSSGRGFSGVWSSLWVRSRPVLCWIFHLRSSQQLDPSSSRRAALDFPYHDRLGTGFHWFHLHKRGDEFLPASIFSRCGGGRLFSRGDSVFYLLVPR